MKKRPSSFEFRRTYVSAETIHILFPTLPLKDLPLHDGLYDPIEALDLAEALGLRNSKSDSETAESYKDKYGEE